MLVGQPSPFLEGELVAWCSTASLALMTPLQSHSATYSVRVGRSRPHKPQPCMRARMIRWSLSRSCCACHTHFVQARSVATQATQTMSSSESVWGRGRPYSNTNRARRSCCKVFQRKTILQNSLVQIRVKDKSVPVGQQRVVDEVLPDAQRKALTADTSSSGATLVTSTLASMAGRWGG
jgi:hypothetical protein